MQTWACTVVTRSHLAEARVLAATFLEHHPGARVAALVLDDPEASVRDEPFEVVRPADLDLPGPELARMASMYDAFELSCALKPWAVEHALRLGADAVAYLDADVEVIAPLGEALDAARAGRVVLTPHHTTPPPQSPRFEHDRLALTGGSFNGGFVATGLAGLRFLAWWKERLARDCLDAIAEGWFVDQRWLDLVPALFEHEVVRDPGWNVAFWNLRARTVSSSPGGYTVDGSPLRFFHFSGYDPHRPYLLSTWLLPDPQVLLSEQPALRELADAHGERLLANGYDEARSVPYAYGTGPDGQPLDRDARRRYREALIEAERTGGPEPDPLVRLA
jgi:hypothetical protein